MEGKEGRAIQAGTSTVPPYTALHHAVIVPMSLVSSDARPSAE